MTLAGARRRIAELEHLNAFISLSEETGEGPVVAVKDLLDVRGMVTTGGGRQLPRIRATEDAEAVRALRAHGVVVVGKTNLHEFAYGSTSENPHYGPVRNPHDPSRSAGGSSGGSAVAAATGMCEWAIGTDTAGSLRIPASACGVASIKPEPGLVPTGGVVPLSRTLDVVGPMAPDLTTAIRGLAMMSGRPDLGLRRPAAAGSLRLAVPSGDWVGGLDAGTDAAWKRVAAGLEPIALPDRGEMSAICTTISMFEATAYHRPWLRSRPDRYGADVVERLRLGEAIPAADHERALAERPRLAAGLDRALEGFDALLVPATAMVAPIIGGPDVREPMTRFTRPFSATGHPVVTLPAPVGGLPVGIQVVGHLGGLARLLEVALALEAIWR